MSLRYSLLRRRSILLRAFLRFLLRSDLLLLAVFGVAEVSFEARGAEARPLVFIGDNDYAPVAFLDEGVARGMDVDLAKALGGPLNREVRIELMDWAVAQENLLKGEGDALIGMSMTDERRERFDFASATFIHEFALFARVGDETIRGISNLKGRNVGVTRGGFPRQVLEAQPGVNLIFIKNYGEGFDQLTAKTVDAVAADIQVAAYLIEKNGIRGVMMVGQPFASAPAAIAVRKGNTALVKEINRALTQLRLDGTIGEIESSWKPHEMLFFSRSRVRRTIGLASASFLVVLLSGMGLWIWSLKKHIGSRKTAEFALRESEQRLRTLTDASFEGIAVCKDGILVDANDQLIKMLRYERSEIIGKPVIELIAPESRDHVRGVIESGRTTPYEHQALRRDGTIFTVEVCGRTIARHPHHVRVTAVRDISERKQSEERLRALASRLQEVREEERTRIAREIHDILAQDLTRLKIDLGWLAKRVGTAENEADRQALSSKVAHLNGLADGTITTVQKIAAELRPVVLDSLGLSAAIEWQAEDFQARTGIRCEAILPDEEVELSREAATGIFRIVQESLTNVIRHSQATHVDIVLEIDEKNHLQLLVRDNGVGFEESRMKDVHSLGLLGMRERAVLLNAKFEIRGEKGKGTEVRVDMPLTHEVVSTNAKSAEEKAAAA